MHAVRDSIRILFVCLGNICRSPLAEAVIRQREQERGLDGCFLFGSAGTGDWHIGGGADARSIITAKAHGLDLGTHRARQITSENIPGWHWFVAMDAENRMDLLAMGANRNRVLMMRQFETPGDAALDVPDPYFDTENGFELVYRLFEANADPLLDYLIAESMAQREAY